VHLDALQILFAILGGLVTGFSKTGVPGVGILVVPLMATVFGGRESIGATIPVLVMGDCFAVAFYHSHADWDKLRKLAPYVTGGLVLGALFLKFLPHGSGTRDPLNAIIGILVLGMLGLQLLRGRLGDRLLPTSPVGTAATGVAAGFSTMASNAAGPIMSIYMTATGLPKTGFMGTSAWYYFIFNLAKIPFVLWLTYDDPSHPLFTTQTLRVDLLLLPVVVIGAFAGRKLLPHIPEKAFTNAVLSLAAIAALKLVFS
jgi:hypothetical protein